MAIITLATDYGTSDGYVAAVIGVIKSISLKAEIISITHQLSSIFKTAFILSRYYEEFPPGTIHMVVIDPTVGTKRRAIAGRANGRYFVGPDNGIFTNVVKRNLKSEWVEIDPSRLPPRAISPTFHGRDIFAPAAAFLANGAWLQAVGHVINEPLMIHLPEPVYEERKITGEIIDIDSFGNLIINIPGKNLGVKPKVHFSGSDIPVARTFADVDRGNPLSYVGSLGYLEIAINDGRAADFFGATVGTKVTVEI